MISSDTVRDLGVLVDNKVKFHDHVSTVTKRDNRILSHKAFEYMDGKTFVNLYKSFVRIIYGNVVWGPHYILDQRSVEKV